jgi:chorismate mutase
MNRVILDNITKSADITRLATAIAQNSNYGQQYEEVAGLYALDVSKKMEECVRLLNTVIQRQHEVHDNH